MATLFELGKAVQARRSEIGLTQAALARLSGLTRQTINQVENGTVADLSLNRAEKLASVLGLSLQVGPSHSMKRASGAARMTPLGRAARTASVSYRESLSPARLRRTLVTGEVGEDAAPYVHALLDEAPVSLLAALAEQLQQEAGSSQAVWKNFRKLAKQVKSRREIWQ